MTRNATSPNAGLGVGLAANRRRVIGALAVGGLGAVVATGDALRRAGPVGAAVLFRQDDGSADEDQSAGEPVGEAVAPAWTVTVTVLQDPYPGQIQAPENPPAGVRFVAAELVIDNTSDQALAFTPVDVRLVDATGVEYRGGAAAGMEPFLGVRNLNGGDRSRG